MMVTGHALWSGGGRVHILYFMHLLPIALLLMGTNLNTPIISDCLVSLQNNEVGPAEMARTRGERTVFKKYERTQTILSKTLSTSITYPLN